MTIKAGLFITLDGVIESPEKWQFDYFNDEMGAAVGALMAGNDGMLLGRRTYDEFAAYWPNADPNDPMTTQLNSVPKYVVSTTVDKAEWENSTVVDFAQVAELSADQTLGMSGSGTLVVSLLREGLLDELHLLVHPVAIGSGKRLFSDGAPVPLSLASATTFRTGVVYLVYTPAA